MRELAASGQRAVYLAQVILLGAIYFAVAKFSLLLAIPPGYATAVWPPSGIALAAALLLGNRIWPGVWLGAALVNYTINSSLFAAVLIGTGNTLEALAGATLIQRYLGVPHRFERGEDVVKFVLFAVLSAAIAATVALVPLTYGHALTWAETFWNWLTWWQGDATGIIIVTPLILAWWLSDATARPPRKILELAGFALLLLAVTGAVFGPGRDYIYPFSLAFVILPFILWAAFRFGRREIATANAAICAIAVWYTVQGSAPAEVSVNEALLVLLAFISTVVVTGLVLGAVVGERMRAMDELRGKHDELEQRVRERTLELERSNRVLLEDMAARTRAEKLLQESEERFRLMTESVVDYAIYMLDPDGRVISWNQGAERIKGYRADEIIGQHVSRFYLPEDVQHKKPGFELGVASVEGRFEDEGWRIRKDGTVFWANVAIAAVRDATGRLIGYTKVTRDLTERKRAESDLMNAKLAAERANLAKSEFLAKMSHELRTPLNSLLILAKLLADNADGRLDEKRVRYARTIYDAGTDLLEIINDLLDLAKIESGAASVPVIATERFAELHDIIERMFRQVARDKGVEFSITLDPQLPETLETDLQRLRQILKNLLANAFKFTKQGRVLLHITLASEGWTPGNARLDAAAQVVSFAVADTGIGIPENKQRLIFEAFQQADGGTGQEYGGTGLGLSISRELARLLGGEIRLASIPGSGSTFTLYLPLAAAPAPRGSSAGNFSNSSI